MQTARDSYLTAASASSAQRPVRRFRPALRSLVALLAMAALAGPTDSQAGALIPCEPTTSGDSCQNPSCPIGGSCVPRCIRFFPQSGATAVESCECRGPEGCQAVPPFATPNPCVLPDGGDGTVHLPPQGCGYRNDPGSVFAIINGLPPGAAILADGIHTNFMCTPAVAVCSFPTGGGCVQAGGSLGGEKSCAASQLQLDMQGVGPLAGYMRVINLPVEIEVHTAPSSPFAPVQPFATDMSRLFGQVVGDPDFDLLRITGGTDFGLPSPGHTTLTQLPGGSWAVDSFFDITYRIDFVGAPGGPLAGMSGSTTGTVRMQTGTGPTCAGLCPPGVTCREQRTVDANGSILICCDCVADVCAPTVDARSCEPVACPEPTDLCVPRCRRYFPVSGSTFVEQCDCRDRRECQASAGEVPGNPCVVPDGGNGTVHLPPGGCTYRNPVDNPLQIIDGLPPATTIDIQSSLTNFACNLVNSVCSFIVPPGCFAPGGTLGGERSCATADLQFSMQGTGALGGYARFLIVPTRLEIHTAPRVLFQPSQEFGTGMFRLFGQITLDPDFDLLRVVVGTDFGLPSPGHTTLTQLPGGDWAVDSFFDITYRIDFVGAPGGPLAGRSGSTTGTVRIQTGSTPVCDGICPPGVTCRRSVEIGSDGSISVCCDCVANCVCPGDMNTDGFVDGRDIQRFVDCYILGSPAVLPGCECADMNGDAVLTPADITAFVNKLLLDPLTACP